MKLTKSEFKTRIGYLALSIVAFYLVDPTVELLNTVVGEVNPFLIGVPAFLIVLYLFDFR